MCVMEVRAGQRSSTIAQAITHNLSTIERDLDMFKALLVGRRDAEALTVAGEIEFHMKGAYAAALKMFAGEVVGEIEAGEAIGNERVHLHPMDQSIVEQAAEMAGRAGYFAGSFIPTAIADAHRAEKFETR